jgi:hypothetical protein
MIVAHLLSCCPRSFPQSIEKGIAKWLQSLVGQFMEKPLPFFLVKKTIDLLWRQYGTVDFS